MQIQVSFQDKPSEVGRWGGGIISHFLIIINILSPLSFRFYDGVEYVHEAASWMDWWLYTAGSMIFPNCSNRAKCY